MLNLFFSSSLLVFEKNTFLYTFYASLISSHIWHYILSRSTKGKKEKNDGKSLILSILQNSKRNILDIFDHIWIVCLWCRIKEVKIGLLIFRMVFPKPRQHFPAFFRRNWHERCTMFLPKVSLRCVEKMLHIILTIEESNAVGCSFVVSQNFLAIRLLNYRFMNMESKKKSQSFWCQILFFS